MQINQLPLSEVNQFSSLFLDYIGQSPKLSEFSDNYPDIQGFNRQIALKKLDIEKRKTLVQTLKKQYANLPNQPNLDILLSENTFTVTTGHQLNIFTGPLYVIYKMITAINLAKKLKSYFPVYNFVPLYWMASEDHDFAEINHFSLFGKMHTWETAQTGAVGRMNPKEMASMIANVPQCPAIFKEAYLNNETLADAVRCYIHELFGSEGLICLDADDRDLKRQLISIIKNDLLQNTAFDLVSKATESLQDLGYKTQIVPREINFFYLANGIRERIIRKGDVFKVLNTNIQFSEREILDLLASEPEKFSPNVVLRPVYQEVILPNLAYIGGPSEVPYWLQLKPIFDFYQIEFPILMPRNFGIFINKISAQRIQKLGLSASDLFLEETTLKKKFVARNTNNVLSLFSENQEFKVLFGQILQKAMKVDKTLEGAVQAEQKRFINGSEKLEKRIRKAEERNMATEISQLEVLKEKLFPNGTSQERIENFLNFSFDNPNFVTQVAETFDPLDFSFYLMVEE